MQQYLSFGNERPRESSHSPLRQKVDTGMPPQVGRAPGAHGGASLRSINDQVAMLAHGGQGAGRRQDSTLDRAYQEVDDFEARMRLGQSFAASQRTIQ